jgi:hypothetical protein
VHKITKRTSQHDHSIDEVSISNKESSSELKLNGKVDCEETEAKRDEEHNVGEVSDIEVVDADS